MFQNHASILQMLGEDFVFVFCYQDVFYKRPGMNKNEFFTPVDLGDSNILYKENGAGEFIPVLFFDRSCNIHFVTEYAGGKINHGFEVPVKLEWIGRIKNDFEGKIYFIPDQSMEEFFPNNPCYVFSVLESFDASRRSRSNSEYIGFEILFCEKLVEEGIISRLMEKFKK